jgi:hypothetical protein
LPRGAGPVDTSRASLSLGQPGCTVKPARRDAERRILVVQAHVTPQQCPGIHILSASGQRSEKPPVGLSGDYSRATSLVWSSKTHPWHKISVSGENFTADIEQARDVDLLVPARRRRAAVAAGPPVLETLAVINWTLVHLEVARLFGGAETGGRELRWVSFSCQRLDVRENSHFPDRVPLSN